MSARAALNRPVVARDVASTFLRSTCLRAVFHRGYVLASSLYFILDAHLSAFQLVVGSPQRPRRRRPRFAISR